MPKFNSASAVEQACQTFRLAEYERGINRGLINDLFNGDSPYSPDELDDNGWNCNINDLSASKIDHDARRQWDSAFISPNSLFTVDLDYGPAFKKREWGQKITKKIMKPLLVSSRYLDLRQGVGASTILHGVGPSIWEDKERWCCSELGIEDVLIPSNTYRSLSNLTMFAVFRQYTYNQLLKYYNDPRIDPGWNKPLLKECLDYIDVEASSLLGSSWPEVWIPEKMAERRKQDGAFYASDSLPTVDCFDFYYYDDTDNEEGWRRRVILDAWGPPGQGASIANSQRKFERGKGKFLYSSRNRVYRSKLDQIMHFQFGDVSAVAPFRYHSVRGLGFLLYAVCHMQNRLKCRFTDSVFESLLQYFRVANPADRDRLQKIDLVHLGILPEGLNFVKPEERWKIDQGLVTEYLQMSRQTMADVSASFSQNVDQEQSKGETATLTMAKASTSAALVSSMLNRAYEYEKARYREFCRRFCIANSKDPDVRAFRVSCLKDGIPLEALNVEAWSIEPNRVIGVGNKQLAIAVVDGIYQMRPTLDPSAQKEVDRMRIAVYSDDYDLADRLVPEEPHVSDSVHDSELVFGTLMTGSPVTPKPGLHPAEVAEKMIQLMAHKITMIKQSGGVGTPQDVVGLQLCAQYAGAFIQMLAEDKNSKPLVKELGDALGKLMNEVKAFAQRQQEAAQKAAEQNGDGGLPPEAKAKIAATVMTAKVKAQNTRESHAAKTAQRQLSFEQKQKQDAEKHAQQMQMETAHARLELGKEAVKTQEEIKRNRLKSLSGGSED